MAAPLAYTNSADHLPAFGTETKSQVLHPLAKMRGQSRSAATLSDDSLTTYMSQIRRIEVLPQEDQNRLARAFKEDNDMEAGKTLVWSNLRLVIKIARDFHRNGQDLMELIQEGNLGLSEALVRFDPDNGTPFIGYAHFWIRAMILNHLLNLSRPVRLGSSRDSRKLFFNLNKARRAVAEQGLEATAENVAEYLDVKIDEVVRVGAVMDAGGVVYLDAPKYGDEDSTSTGIDFMEDPAEEPDDEVSDRMFRKRLSTLAEEFVETLPDDRRIKIWRERMIALEPRYLKDLGDEFGVSKERIRQLEADIQKRFRVYLERNMGSEIQEFLKN